MPRPPLFTHCWATKVRIIKFDDTAQPMSLILLTHGNTDASEHGPCSFVGCPKHRRQLHSGNASLVLTHKIERQKPLRQWHMGLVQHRPCRYRGLMAALGALISSVGQPVSMTATALGAGIPGLPVMAQYVVNQNSGNRNIISEAIFDVFGKDYPLNPFHAAIADFI